MIKDPYRSSARYYDRLFDGMNKGLRLVGIRMFRPAKGMSILDVGCGTGTHLELYLRYQCKLFGIDLSSSMLEVAHKRLIGSAQLNLGDGTSMPYKAAVFDLIIAMLTLHEMNSRTRDLVLQEIKRVLKQEGRILLIDFHPGPYQPLQGWTSKIIISLVELAAGREHFRNYRIFMAEGGLARLISKHGLKVEKQQVLAGGTFSIYLVQ